MPFASPLRELSRDVAFVDESDPIFIQIPTCFFREQVLSGLVRIGFTFATIDR